MSFKKIRTMPDLTETSEAHKVAVSDPTRTHLSAWNHNVVSKYKGLSIEEIKDDLKKTCYPFAACVENLAMDFNISSVVRNVNAFNLKAFYYLGLKKTDRRGACGTYNYTPMNWLPTIDDFIALKKQYKFIAIDNSSKDAIPLDEFIWEDNSLLIFGNEGVGITDFTKNLCESMVFIKQFGSVPSLNVATSSGIIFNDIVTKYNKRKLI